MGTVTKIVFNRDEKYDIQLKLGQEAEQRVAQAFNEASFDKLEVKSEEWLWEQTGNIAIECRRGNILTGIATTDAQHWVHELKRDGRPLLWLVVPMERLKELCRKAWKEGRVRRGGDGGKSQVILLRLRDLLR